MSNSLKTKLNAGKVIFGTFLPINSPDIAEILALAGFDFVVIDTEHGSMSIESTQNLIRAVELRNCVPIVRVTENHDTTILRTLDIGARGLHVPQVNSKADAQKMVQAAKYYPEGNRGAAMPRAAKYGMEDLQEYLNRANAETLLISHIENIKGVNNIAEIIDVQGIDVLFLGPYDLSQSLGFPGQVAHPKVEDAMQKVVKAATEAKIPLGTFVTNLEDAKKRIDQGFTYITYNFISSYIGNFFRAEVAKLQKLLD